MQLQKDAQGINDIDGGNTNLKKYLSLSNNIKLICIIIQIIYAFISSKPKVQDLVNHTKYHSYPALNPQRGTTILLVILMAMVYAQNNMAIIPKELVCPSDPRIFHSCWKPLLISVLETTRRDFKANREHEQESVSIQQMCL
jgi:hypothetical protein